MSKANIFEKLLKEIGNTYGVCGLMGNIQAESNFRSDNAQNSYMTKMGLTDAQYTKMVDDGAYTDFGSDRVGYGLCQWTSAGRKAGLYNYAKSTGRSISDENMQIEWLIHELNVAYKSVMNGLKSAKSVKDASDLVVLEFERPGSVGKNATEEEKNSTLSKRQAYGEAIYIEFCKKSEEKKSFKVCIDAGHFGKYNQSPGNPAYFESEVMWNLHLLQKKHLEALGIEVITTRTNKSNDLSLKTRGKKADGCDLFISNHSNAVAGGMNESVDYVAVYHLTNDHTTTADDRSKEIAKILAPVIASTMKVKQGYKVLTRDSNEDRNGDGIFNDNYYGVLNGARLVNVPGLILEHSFHTNSRSVQWLLDPSNLDRLAKAEAEAIAAYLKNDKPTQEAAPEADTKPEEAAGSSYKVRITASSLNVRAGAGTAHKINTSVSRGEVFTIVEESNGWGKLKSGAGWISLKYTEKIDAAKPEEAAGSAYKVRITASSLNVRAGAGTAHKINTSVSRGEVFTIVDESNGWGKLKSGAGWISLKYTDRV